MTFVAPTVLGAYEWRLYANNSYERIATSATVTVAPAPTCNYFVTPPAIAAGAPAQSGWVAVTTTGSGCTAWTPQSSASWLTLGTPIVDEWNGFGARVLADGPLGNWNFHETIGATTAVDGTGHGLTAALVGGAAVNTLGFVDLDGTSGRVVVGPSPLLTMRNALTAELWLQTTKARTRVIGAANDPWELYVGDGGVLELRLLGQVLQGRQVVTDDQSHFVDATWDGSTAALYIDGVLDAQLAVSGTLASSAGGLTIGAHPTNGNYFAGQLAVVVVFEHALTAAQVADRWLWFNGVQSDTSGVFAYTVETNWSHAARAATITIATGQKVDVLH